MLPLSFGESFLEAEQIQRRVSGEQESLCENSLGFGHLIPFNLEKYVRYPTQVVLDFPQANSACCRQIHRLTLLDRPRFLNPGDFEPGYSMPCGLHRRAGGPHLPPAQNAPGAYVWWFGDIGFEKPNHRT